MSIQSAASRQCNLRGGSNNVYYERMLIKAIYDIQHFKKLFYNCGTYIHSKSTKEEKKRSSFHLKREIWKRGEWGNATSLWS